LRGETIENENRERVYRGLAQALRGSCPAPGRHRRGRPPSMASRAWRPSSLPRATAARKQISGRDLRGLPARSTRRWAWVAPCRSRGRGLTETIGAMFVQVARSALPWQEGAPTLPAAPPGGQNAHRRHPAPCAFSRGAVALFLPATLLSSLAARQRLTAMKKDPSAGMPSMPSQAGVFGRHQRSGVAG